MRQLIASAVTVSLGLVTSTAFAQPDPTQPYVNSVVYGGTGCPQGSVGSSFSNDRQSATLIFDVFVASTGPGVPVTEARKNCQLNLNVYSPPGHSFATFTVDARGYVSAPEAVGGEQKATFYYGGETGAQADAETFDGPTSRDYLARTLVVVEVIQPAGRVRPLNVNSQVRLLGPAGTEAQITLDSYDFVVAGDGDPGSDFIYFFCDDNDGDGLCATEDVCPNVADEDQLDTDGDGIGDACEGCADGDGDGVCDGDDVCPASVPDVVKNLLPYRYAELDLAGAFETRAFPWPAAETFTLEDTAGCTCAQIGAALHLSPGLVKHGCSVATMWLWTLLVD